MCVGNGDKDDFYRKIKGNIGYDFNGFDGLLEMKNVDKFGLSWFGFEFEGVGMNKEFEFWVIGLDFDMSRENRRILIVILDIVVNMRGLEINVLEVFNEDVDFDISGLDVSIFRI